MNLIAILASALLTVTVTGPQADTYREALKLYENGLYSRAKEMFDQVSDKTGNADPAGYSLLCDVRAKVPGYENRIEAYFENYPYSRLTGQIRYHHALNLFDAEDYKAASEQFAKIKEDNLYKSQRTEFAFKSAYCDLENDNVYSARDGFKDVEGRKHSDFTAPSRYGIGYVEYKLKHFREAIPWFEKAAKDPRFAEMAEYYVLECRFLLKDYEYVLKKGTEMFNSAPAERKSHLARMISESYFVKDDVDNAKKFYEEYTLAGDKTAKTSADWFYSGSILYAVKDYKGAIDSYLMMDERKDSLGQIANYNLGYSYIQTKDKVSAYGAFKEASQATYSEEITEDAFFNYAKLAFDLNDDISVFNDYLAKYSDARKGDRIYSYIAVANLMDHDYEAAVQAYDKIEELDLDMRFNYMKANYLRANQLIGSGSYRRAVPCLKAAAYYSEKNSGFNQLSRFWLAEAYYRDDQYETSRNILSELYNMSALNGRVEGSLIPYNIAFCYFKEGNYSLAHKWFDEYLLEKSLKFRKEAMLRKADCLFAQKDYAGAAAAYDAVIDDYYSADDIYPYYQSALSYGLIDNYDRKIGLLSGVLNASSGSEFYPEALFELGRTYAVREDDANAMKCFDTLTRTVKDSTFVAKAYVEMGTIARNQSMFNEALGYYKTVVEEMPLSELADDALLAIESIYQTRNEPQEYLAYIESIGKGEIKTDVEKENMIFNSAEQVFLSENYQKAIVALQDYMEKYPQGANIYKADFYLAESYRQIGKYEQACDSYKLAIDHGEGSFVELSLLNFANLSYSLERWDDASGGYMTLYQEAKLPNNTFVAALGVMRSSFRGHEWETALKWCETVLSDERSQAEHKTEAEYIKAKSLLAVSRRDEAFEILESLAADVHGEYGAEAAFMLIQDCYDRGMFDEVETKVYAFSDARSSQTYWLAKSFIVLGDTFMERDDVEQAVATFESVRDGYAGSPDDGVLDNVNLRLNKIAAMQQEVQ